MAEPEWGLKRICPACGVRFYDLTNDPTTCPSCAETFPLDALSERKSSSGGRSRSKAAVEKAAPAAAAEDADVIDDDDADADDDDDESSSADVDVLLDDDEDDDDLGDITPGRSENDDES